MILAIVIMSSIWGIAVLIRKIWIKDCGVFVAILLSVIIASGGAVLQVFIATTMNERAGLEIDPMSYIRNAFLTLCISLYIVYSTLRKSQKEQETSEA